MARVTIDKLAEMMQKEFSSIHEDIAGVKSEIGSVRSELTSKIESEIGSVRSEINSVRSELSSKIESEIGSVRSEMNSEFSSIRADILGLKMNNADIREDIKKLNDRIVLNTDLIVEDNAKTKARLLLVERKLKTV